MRIVLDAWALLAYLQGEEPAASRLRDLFKQAQSGNPEIFASLINVGEVYYRVGRRQGQDAADETLEELRLLPLTILTPLAETVIDAARLKVHYALSYADAFAAATAQKRNATLWTGDAELLAMKKTVRIESLRREQKKVNESHE